MKLNQEQLKENELFFNKVASISKFYAWPDTGFIYEIKDGVFICESRESYEMLKQNTPKSFHDRVIYIDKKTKK